MFDWVHFERNGLFFFCAYYSSFEFSRWKMIEETRKTIQFTSRLPDKSLAIFKFALPLANAMNKDCKKMRRPSILLHDLTWKNIFHSLMDFVLFISWLWCGKSEVLWIKSRTEYKPFTPSTGFDRFVKKIAFHLSRNEASLGKHCFSFFCWEIKKILMEAFEQEMRKCLTKESLI